MSSTFVEHADQRACILDKVQRREISIADAVSELSKLRGSGAVAARRAGAKNDSLGIVYRYDESYLPDHAINHDQVILGVTYASLALDAYFGARASETDAHLHGLSFVTPVLVKKDQAVELSIDLSSSQDAMDFKVQFRHEHDAPWAVSATGSFRKTTLASRWIDITALQSAGHELTDLDSIYAYFYGEQHTVTVGESLRVIRRLFKGDDRVLARVSVPGKFLAAEKHRYALHPLIVQSAFFAVTPLLGSFDKNGYLPFAIKDLYFSKRVAGADDCWLIVKSVRNLGEVVTFDAELVGDDQQVIASLTGCSFKRFRAVAAAAPAARTVHLSNQALESDAAKSVQRYLLHKLEKCRPGRGNAANLTINLMDLGIESQQLVALASEIEQEIGVDFGPTLFFEYPNIKELADYFHREHRERFLASSVLHETQTRAAVEVAEAAIDPRSQRESRRVNVEVSDPTVGDIAIVGVHVQFAGARSVDQFWDNILQRKDLITEVPFDHWDYRPWYDASRSARDGTYCKWGSFLEEVDRFDAAFFHISPREAEWMDPQARLLLQSIYSCAEDAGCINQLRGSDTGVFVGACTFGYAERIAELNPVVDPHAGSGNLQTLMANRVSFIFNFKGPSVTVNTACSSSLVALHYATNALRRGECATAFVSGVNLLLSSLHYRYLSCIGALSPSGRCNTFDSAADGYVPGEGIASILLKPLQQAQADGDHIYAVIKGSAALHGGYTPSLTAPSVAGEENVILKAWENARIDPATLSYIEAHGTGTPLGDPIEVSSLKKAFSRFTQQQAFCAMGSAKSNIGHAEGAAGIAGVLKVIQQMRHGKIPAMPRFRTLNPLIRLDGSPLYINQEPQAWTSPPGVPRRAGVSSFGISGAYAHVVIEEYLAHEPTAHESAADVSNPVIIVLSARNREQLREQAKRLRAFIEEKAPADNSLVDMAYTLQVGREAMEARVAMLVTSIDELPTRLGGFIEGRGDLIHVYTGSISGNEQPVEALAADEDFQATLQAWIRKKKYAKVAQLWASGLQLDWQCLYDRAKPRRISLPTYAFAGERYWIPASAGQVRRALESSSQDAIHPLLHRNTSDFLCQRYTTTFRGTEFYLTDHVLHGSKVLPGVAYLEIARTAVEAATAKSRDAGTILELKNIVWTRPIVVNDAAVEISIKLLPEANGDVAYDICQAPEAGHAEEIVHSQGVVALLPSSETTQLDIAALRSQCSRSRLTAAECYETFASAGLVYGPAHRGIVEIHIGEEQVLAQLSLPASVSSTLDQYVLHPSVLDSALQASMGLLLDQQQSAGKALVPFALESIEVHERCTAAMWAHIRYSAGCKRSNAVQRLDVDLMDESGRVCARLRGFSSRVLEADAERSQGLLMLQPQWQEQACEADIQEMPATRHVVLLCEYPGLSVQQIQRTLPGIHCRALSCEQPGIDQRYEQYAVALFEEIKGQIGGKAQEEVLIQVLMPEHPHGSVLQGLSGILKTANAENPRIRGQVIQLEAEVSTSQLVERLTQDSRRPADALIRYAQGKRWALREQEVQAPELPGLPWKEGGVYLITGGAGGLGLIFARHIAQQTPGVTLILTGRSALDAAKQAQLEQIAQGGSQVIYRAVDVRQREALEALIEEIQAKHGGLNGVLHAAGIIRDNFILKKSVAEFRDVLASKVAGLVNLDEATRQLPLDLFVTFSSIAGVLGNVGQSDYAAANAFMDGYAAYRNQRVRAGERYGKTLSINWPLWLEGGMRMDRESQELLMAGSGVELLQTSIGLQAFYRSLSLPQHQVIVFEGNRARMRHVLFAPREPVLQRVEQSSSGIDKDGLLQKAEGYLRDRLSMTFKLAPDQIDPLAPLDKYGIDSILAMQLTNELDLAFGKLSKTLFFEYQTTRQLAQYFVQTYPDLVAALAATESGRAKSVATKNESAHRKAQNRLVTSDRPRFTAVTKLTTMRGAAEPIAVIGLSGRYPEAVNLKEYWRNLRDGKDCVVEVPAERWNWSEFYTTDLNASGRHFSKWGGFISGVDEFDPDFFNIAPREAEIMDPQERLFLQHAWMAIEDAGYTRTGLQIPDEQDMPGQGGVYVGVMYGEYNLSGSLASIANRVSYFLNLHGPSISFDTMCSSSLTAIHIACQDLRQRRTSVAIAGGVNVSIHPHKYSMLSAGRFISTQGHCQSFGAGGDGYIPGEGVGVVVLKRLSDAIQDGDHIYGVIKGSAITHGGKTNGYSVPNPHAQASAVRRALADANLDARHVSYIEAHGTGTKLGDPIEIAALTQAFGKQTQDTGFCLIGSAKSNLGHCESAAGIAGLTKVLLQMKHRQIVPSLHSAQLNPHIEFDKTPFIVNQSLRHWARPVIDGREIPRIAGISSFGAGGANAHMIVEEYQTAEDRRAGSDTANHRFIVPLSARTTAQLRQKACDLLDFIREESSAIDLERAAYTLQVGRETMEERLGFIVSSINQLEEKLRAYVEDERLEHEVFRGKAGAAADLQRQIDEGFDHNDPAKLLELWAKGVALDSERINSGRSRPRRVSLPTYPFARERYWCDLTGTAHHAENERNQASRTAMFLEKRWRLSQIVAATETSFSPIILHNDATRKLAETLGAQCRAPVLLNEAEISALVCEQTLGSADTWVDLTGIRESRFGDTLWTAYLQALIEKKPAPGLRLIYTTQGLEAHENAVRTLDGAGKVGLYRALQSEYPSLTSRHVDLDPAHQDHAEQAAIILRELSCRSSDVSVCYRRNQRYSNFLHPLELRAGRSPGAVPGHSEVALVTGGTRGLGLACARHLISRHGFKRIVLTGKEALPAVSEWRHKKKFPISVQRKIESIQALQALGAEVQVRSFPLDDPQALRDQYAAVQASMGDITAIIHAAGVADRDNFAFIRKTPASIANVLAPKVLGLQSLMALVNTEKLRFAVLFSSVSALIPDLASGQSDYAMANAFMDYFAASQAPNLPIVSIQWPSWKDSGMGEVKSRAYRDSGLLSISDAEGLGLLDIVLSNLAHPVIMPVMVDASRFDPGRLLQARAVEREQGPSASIRGDASDSNTMEHALHEWLSSVFVSELKLKQRSVDADVPFVELGADSILLAQVLSQVNKALGLTLDPSLLLEHATIRALASWLQANQAEALSRIFAESAANAPPVTLQPVSQEGVPRSSPTRHADRAEPIAVVGMACRFPGASTLAAYWDLLADGRSAIAPVPDDCWGVATGYHAGLLDEIYGLDPEFFRIHPDDLQAMDPQALVLLEESLKAIHDAGYTHTQVAGANVGVYIGARAQVPASFELIKRTRNPIMTIGQNYLAANLSQFFDLRGPSLVVDTACSSALVAMNLAVEQMRAGAIDAALVGGISLLTSPAAHELFAQRNLLQKDGMFHVLDGRASGVVLGEGCGCVLLKPLSQARRDGDRIYAQIAGISINNDGRTAGPATPSLEAQKAVMRAALEKSGCRSEEIPYLEVNGSGSEVPDLLEMKAVSAIYASATDAPRYLGSIKPNIGHPLCAEGIAAFIKVALLLHRQRVVPFLSGKEPMRHFSLEQAGFALPRQAHATDLPYAALNCFADGGTNAHIVLQRSPTALESVQRTPVALPPMNRVDVRTLELL
jgi:polyketide synthase PksN